MLREPFLSLSSHRKSSITHISQIPFILSSRSLSVRPTMEEEQDSIVEERDELMVSPFGNKNPILRKAHFIKPSATSFDRVSSPSSSLLSSSEHKTFASKISFNSWRRSPKRFRAWAQKMASLHEPMWRKAGIFQAVMVSMYNIRKDVDLVPRLSEKWCPSTNTFIFRRGEATITLEDVSILMGYSVLGCSVLSAAESGEMEETMEKLEKSFSALSCTKSEKPCQSLWMKIFMNSGDEIEHEAFLAMWLSRFVFATSFNFITKDALPIAASLARGIRMALAPAVLASLYRDLSCLKEYMASSGCEKISLSSPIQLVQVWAWERFPELRPNPKLIQNGEPRIALWNEVKIPRNVDDLIMVVDAEIEQFIWRPYAKPIRNWNLPKVYAEQEMWLLVASRLDDEFISFAQVLRTSELVGIDCMEQYLPNRVALQFGYDQDLPGHVPRYNRSSAVAWDHYSRPICDVKLYVPSRNLEAGVTTRYLQWWKQSVLKKRGSIETREQGADSGDNLSESSCPRKELPLSFIVKKELDNSSFPLGFAPKCDKPDAGEVNEEDSITIAKILGSRKRDVAIDREKGQHKGASDSDGEDDLTIADMFGNKRNKIMNQDEAGGRTGLPVNFSGGRFQCPFSSVAETVNDINLPAETAACATRREYCEKVPQISFQVTMESKETDPVQEAVCVKSSKACNSYSIEVLASNLEAQVRRLESIFAKLKNQLCMTSGVDIGFT